MILGICGRKKHGKDKFASMLAASMPALDRVSFAKRLKEVCVRVYGLNEAQVNDEIGKEMLLSVPIALDDRIQQLRAETGAHNIGPHGLVAKTPRQVLQFVGTDYVREACPSYWLDIVGAQFSQRPGADFAVTDVRFPNEAELIRSRGGKIVRILRIASEVKGGESPEHSSERMDFDPDYTIATMENDFSLSKIICESFAARGMLQDGLEAFNWDLLCFSAPVFRAYYDALWPDMCKVTAEMLATKVVA